MKSICEEIILSQQRAAMKDRLQPLHQQYYARFLFDMESHDENRQVYLSVAEELGRWANS